MLNWVKQKLGFVGTRLQRLIVPVQVRAKYDAAQTTDENRRHWAMADGLSPNASASREVRRILRNRCRYEVANNSFARGIVSTLANDTVGTGPRLQMLSDNPTANRAVEAEFTAWSAAVNLPEKLRTMRMAKTEDGEAFALMLTNPVLATTVKLDLRLVEADQVTTPLGVAQQQPSPFVDGIVYDRFRNPLEYHILKTHPGDQYFNQDFDRIPADSVIHYFRAERPGQCRGIPEITSSIALFAYLRRYVLAVILGAETAANFAAVLKTNAPANGESAEVEPNAVIEVERNSLTAVPEGWDISQLKAEQPTTTFSEFCEKIVSWISRCVSMPFNIAACDSSKYNYASGRLDHQTYDMSIRVERSFIENVILDRIFKIWLARQTSFKAPHEWYWDGREHIDPLKDSTAQETRLRVGTTTLAREGSKAGVDWETLERQRIKEMKLRLELYQTELGLSRDEAIAILFPDTVTTTQPIAEGTAE
jgi:lambda family phage portal protein